MYQTLPSAEHYKQIERDIISRGKPSSLTLAELEQQQDTRHYEAGYATYTGYKLNKVEAESLNRLVAELNRSRCLANREFIKDRIHQEFVICAEEMTADQIYQADKKNNALKA